ncbi:MAG: RNA methyltransferase [Rhodanobacteraceae bacterium]|nr:RNA methyltransferase [Rhodanobacteraceae bacterium]MBK7044511.1 RNA methyltransferase [Rhodanobacteraceae bacterium]MBP9154317.1 RNA methyltransferase [Xanthomonadales bacterium]HQW81339.1 RNA methyltransferase [Pseudomonadota bacterium]
MSLREFLLPIRVVLIDTALPENIGAAARAMKTMGLSDLALVRPKLFPDQRANALAAGADDLLERAQIYDSLTDAIADCVYAAGCTARLRDISLPLLEPGEAAQSLLTEARRGPVALVFGAERTGLTNEDLSRCDAAVHIPTEAEFSSLNLAQAVQVLSFCIRSAALTITEVMPLPLAERDDPPATIEQMERMFEHFEQALAEIDFFKGRPYGHLMQRIRRMLHRADLDTREVMIFRGILADAQRMARLAESRINK